MNRMGKQLLAVVCCAVLAISDGSTAAAAPPLWKTDAAFQRALASPFGVVNWPQGSRLRDQLQRLAEWQRVAIFLDRRIDPDRSIELSARQITLAELLAQLAVQADGTVSYVGSVVYIGPQDKVAGLASVAQQRAREARALPDVVGRPLLTRRRWGWDELAEPRALLVELAQEVGMVIEGIETIPHDLWPQADLPPLSWTDRMSIVLAGFGLTFELADQGQLVRLVPLPQPTLETRAYSTTLSQMNWEQIARQFPNVELQRLPKSITLKGTAEQHDRLKQLLAQQASSKRPRTTQPKTVHSLRVTQQPIGAILKTLERQLQLRLDMEPDVQEKLQTRVTFDLRGVPLDELLDATLAPASLDFQRDGDVIRIKTRE